MLRSPEVKRKAIRYQPDSSEEKHLADSSEIEGDGTQQGTQKEVFIRSPEVKRKQVHIYSSSSSTAETETHPSETSRDEVSSPDVTKKISLTSPRMRRKEIQIHSPKYTKKEMSFREMSTREIRMEEEGMESDDSDDQYHFAAAPELGRALPHLEKSRRKMSALESGKELFQKFKALRKSSSEEGDEFKLEKRWKDFDKEVANSTPATTGIVCSWFDNRYWTCYIKITIAVSRVTASVTTHPFDPSSRGR